MCRLTDACRVHCVTISYERIHATKVTNAKAPPRGAFCTRYKDIMHIFIEHVYL